MTCDFCGTPYTYVEFIFNPFILISVGILVSVLGMLFVMSDEGACVLSSTFGLIPFTPFLCFFPTIGLILISIGVIKFILEVKSK